MISAYFPWHNYHILSELSIHLRACSQCVCECAYMHVYLYAHTVYVHKCTYVHEMFCVYVSQECFAARYECQFASFFGQQFSFALLYHPQFKTGCIPHRKPLILVGCWIYLSSGGRLVLILPPTCHLSEAHSRHVYKTARPPRKPRTHPEKPPSLLS